MVKIVWAEVSMIRFFTNGQITTKPDNSMHIGMNVLNYITGYPSSSIRMFVLSPK